MPTIPSTLAVTNCAFAMDGGSRVIALRDAAGGEHTLCVPQHHIGSNFTPGEPPGALIFDGAVLDVRGAAERDLVAALRVATYAYAEKTRAARHEKIAPPERRLVLGEDVSATLAAIDEGPEAALRHAVASVLEFVESDEYVDVARRLRRVT